MKSVSLLFTSLAIVSSISCSSIVSKSSYPVTVNSAPSGLKYTIKNSKDTTISSGRTPATVTLNASNGFFKAAKYQIDILQGTKVVGSTELAATLDGWYFGNVLVGGLVGLLIVDPASGAMWALPAEVTVHKNTLAAHSAASELQVAYFSTLTEQQRQRLIKLESN